MDYQNSAEQERLEMLSAKVKADLHTLRYPEDSWLLPFHHESGRHVYDVAIIGGGQSGLAVAAGLIRDRVDNIVVFDRQPAGREGPWMTYARMLTLRTPKHLPGIDPTLPNLSPETWYTTRYGQDAWQKLDRIPKKDWQDYLDWCKNTLDIPVRNLTEVTDVIPEEKVFKLHIRNLSDNQHEGTGDEIVYARRLVVATGVDGGGVWYVPDFITASLPADRYASSGEAIDFGKLKGKRVAVLGAGASAFDNASTALEAGAREATVCIRRSDIQRINPQMWMAKAGFLSHYADLDDEWKWRFMRHMFRYNIPAPQTAYERLSALPGASIRQNAAWRSVTLVGTDGKQEIEVVTASGEVLHVDFLIVAIGFVQDFKLRPELARMAPSLALWGDRFQPPFGESDPQIATHPYLGKSFEFLEKEPGSAPYLSSVFNFTYSAIVSMGLSGAAISGFKYSVPRLVRGITKSLFLEDIAKTHQQFVEWSQPELVGEVPFRNAPWD